MLAFLYCFLVKSKINSSKKFTSSGDWTWDPRTVTPLVFTLSCLPSWANLTLLGKLGLSRSLCSHALFFLAKYLSPIVNNSNLGLVLHWHLQLLVLFSVLQYWLQDSSLPRKGNVLVILLILFLFLIYGTTLVQVVPGTHFPLNCLLLAMIAHSAIQSPRQTLIPLLFC